MAFEIKTFNTLFVVIIVLSLQSRLKHEKGNGLGECFEILCTFTSVRKCKGVKSQLVLGGYLDFLDIRPEYHSKY
jgi:hypothetical protein